MPHPNKITNPDAIRQTKQKMAVEKQFTVTLPKSELAIFKALSSVNDKHLKARVEDRILQQLCFDIKEAITTLNVDQVKAILEHPKFDMPIALNKGYLKPLELQELSVKHIRLSDVLNAGSPNRKIIQLLSKQNKYHSIVKKLLKIDRDNNYPSIDFDIYYEKDESNNTLFVDEEDSLDDQNKKLEAALRIFCDLNIKAIEHPGDQGKFCKEIFKTTMNSLISNVLLRGPRTFDFIDLSDKYDVYKISQRIAMIRRLLCYYKKHTTDFDSDLSIVGKNTIEFIIERTLGIFCGPMDQVVSYNNKIRQVAELFKVFNDFDFIDWDNYDAKYLEPAVNNYRDMLHFNGEEPEGSQKIREFFEAFRNTHDSLKTYARAIVNNNNDHLKETAEKQNAESTKLNKYQKWKRNKPQSSRTLNANHLS